jgi:hypothetical protein
LASAGGAVQDAEGKTPEDVAEAVKENEMVDFLRACATGKIPAKAPVAKVNDNIIYINISVDLKFDWLMEKQQH